MFERFKSIVRDGERYIVVEGGEPLYVVMSFGDYARLVAEGKPKAAPNAPRARPAAWPEAARHFGEARPDGAASELSVEAPAEPTDPATVRLEDLPI